MAMLFVVVHVVFLVRVDLWSTDLDIFSPASLWYYDTQNQKCYVFEEMDKLKICVILNDFRHLYSIL